MRGKLNIKFPGRINVKIKWLGHSSFLITSDQGTRIITDPFTPGRGMDYMPIAEAADIVTVSHSHDDHSNVKTVKGNPQVIKQEGNWTIKGIEARGIPSFHDSLRGSQRGNNIIFCFAVDSVNICHLGDLGHLVDEKLMTDIGPVDILLIPVGGFFTIDATQATEVAGYLNAKITIPMHFKTAKTGLPIAPVDDFLKGKSNVRRLNSNEIEITKTNLPDQAEILVFEFPV
jgi:L-ascorbate metabolism protein UlaG (beta-lactamase superfamily)